MIAKKYQHNPDYTLIIISAILVIVGIVMLCSASTVIAYQKFGDGYFYLKHQILNGLLPGLILFFICYKIKYDFFRKNSFLFLMFTLVLLLLILFVPSLRPENVNAKSWLSLGELSFQPSELLKLTLILYLSAWFEKIGKGISNFKQGFLPFIIILVLVSGLIIAQPDIGTLSIIILIALSLYFTAGAKISHVIGIVSAGIVSLGSLILIAPYRIQRFLVFLNPSLDPQGIGYHINQALIGIGSGGILGVGLGHSRQKFIYLPEVIGDSIFAIIGEELGFILTILIVVLFIFLTLRILKIAQYAPDKFCQLTAIGVASWIIFQAFANIMAMLSLMPLTGLPLPFISHGGSALMVLLASLGLLFNMSRYTTR
ncbi:MAG: putative lipid II flippase FtsW [Patescibacteria group bacterium]|nr:putative lipid II flippase FtsW [Patescibacteria group bacterium]